MHFVNTVQFKKAVEISLSFKMCFRKLTWSFSGGRVDLDLGVGGWWGIVSHWGIVSVLTAAIVAKRIQQ